MPRAISHTRATLVDSALITFWKHGYQVVSIVDLVRETGVSRGGIYSDFAGKQELFHACLDRYQEVVVTPVFAPVEAEGAGIDAIRQYLENLLARYDESGGLGIGCLVANTLGQIRPEETETRERLDAHGRRLTAGFRRALSHENAVSRRMSDGEVDALASFTMVSVQGLWSFSRSTNDSNNLHQLTNTLLACLEARVRGAP